MEKGGEAWKRDFWQPRIFIIFRLTTTFSLYLPFSFSRIAVVVVVIIIFIIQFFFPFIDVDQDRMTDIARQTFVTCFNYNKFTLPQTGLMLHSV